MRATCDEVGGGCLLSAVTARAERAEAARDAAVALLKDAEWRYNERAGCNVCVVCDGDEPKHFADCALHRVLAEVGE